jgi:hypothetical protein
VVSRADGGTRASQGCALLCEQAYLATQSADENKVFITMFL